MRIAFLLYPTAKVKVDEDSSFWIYHELQRRGHRVFAFESHELISENGRLSARLSSYRTDPSKGFILEQSNTERTALESMDILFIRKEPPFDTEYLYALQLLATLSKKVFILNDPQGIALCNEKLFILRFSKFIPDSFVTSEPDDAKKFIQTIGARVVIKPLNLKGGEGIFATHARDRHLLPSLRRATQNGTRRIMVQRFIPHSKEGDKRILLLNGNFLGCFVRRAGAMDFRANLSLGGSFHRAKLTNREEKLIKHMRPELKRQGLYFVGLDVIRGYLSEVNVTSPSGIPELKHLEHVSLEKRVADFIERRERFLGRKH